MIITQTPLRVGLVGGGTDLPDYYRLHGGRVLNCAIDKHVYVINLIDGSVLNTIDVAGRVYAKPALLGGIVYVGIPLVRG